MKMTERLGVIDKLVLSGSAPAEIRGHITAIQEQLEANEQEAEKVSEYKKRIIELEAEKADLNKQLRIAKDWKNSEVEAEKRAKFFRDSTHLPSFEK